MGHRSRHSGRRRHRPRTQLLEVGPEKPRRGRHRRRPPDDGGSLLAGVVGARNCSRRRFLVPQILGGYFLARSLQGRRFNAHIVSGGKKASNWLGAGIGLAVFTPLIGAVVVFVLISGINPSAIVDMQYSVDMGHDHHVYYSRGATRDDAQRFGEALETEGYFDGTTPADVLISGKAGAREISFFGGEGVWEDESYVEAVRAMAERIAPAIGGKPLTVRIVDENLNEKKRLQIE